VTNRFLSKESTNVASAYDTAKQLLLRQDDPEIKERLLQRVKTLQADVPLNSHTFVSFLSLSASALMDGVLRPEDSWIEQTVESFREPLLEQGMHPYIFSQNIEDLDFSRARSSSESPEEIIARVQTMYGLQELDASALPDSESRLTGIELDRDLIFQSLAQHYAESGDFSAVGLCLSKMSNDSYRTEATSSCLDKAQTAEQLAEIKFDDQSLATDDMLNTIFRVREAAINGDVAALHGIAGELIDPSDWEDDHRRNLISKCVVGVYTHGGEEQGQQLVAELADVYCAGGNAERVKDLVSLRLRCNDVQGLRELFSEAYGIQNSVIQLSAYADLAQRAQKFLT